LKKASIRMMKLRGKGVFLALLCYEGEPGYGALWYSIIRYVTGNSIII
jgi:hypothetical protein